MKKLQFELNRQFHYFYLDRILILLWYIFVMMHLWSLSHGELIH